MLVSGSHGALLIDPSVTVVERGGAPERVDRILVSHAHEDHLAGIGTFPDSKVHAHHNDLLGLQSLDGLMEVYGMPIHIETKWRDEVVEKFFYTPRADASGFADGEEFDLGGVRVQVVHLPGHTRGHCGFLVEPDGVFFVADVDLTSFGPYYGDHWSDLEDFERAIEKCRHVDAKSFVTFHHKGVVHGRSEFLTQLDKFAAVIQDREQRLLAFLSEPRSIEDIVQHRFIYRPGAQVLFADHVERTSMGMHLDRLLRDGAISLDEGKYRTT